jgi:hypothetical protein
MPTTTKVKQIGFKQAAQIANMPTEARLAFIAEGLPIIFESAKSLVAASRALEAFARERKILEGHAVEECAKILILVDLVRCPPKRSAALAGTMMKWFYSHLARIIYADAQAWKPMSIDQLQEYVDNERPTHYLEGDFSEYIMPNSALYRREGAMYADVVGNEDAEPEWSSPLGPAPMFGSFEPHAWRLVDALDAIGLFTPKGLEVLTNTWGDINFERGTPWSEAEARCWPTALACEAAGLLQKRLTQAHANVIAHDWQMPMYEIDFSPIEVTLEEMRARRDRAFWNEVL